MSDVSEIFGGIFMEVENITIERIVKEIQISDFAQFIDVLEAIESYKNIEDVKKDIIIRKKLLEENIEMMKKSLSRN